MTPSEKVYFVVIGDSHIGPSAGDCRHGHLSLPCAQRMVDTINSLPGRVDFVVHVGDIVTNPEPEAYELANEVFADLRVPIYYVNGNHDDAGDLLKWLPMGSREDLSLESNGLNYAFEVKGYRFLVLDAKGPAETDPRGLLSRDAMDILRSEVGQDGLPLTVFIHFPALSLNSTWMDENMLIMNGLEMHELLQTAKNRLRAVFHGHIHQNMQTIREGIVYISAASTYSQFTAWPGAEHVIYDSDHDPGYLYVHLTPKQTIVHQHTFPRP